MKPGLLLLGVVLLGGVWLLVGEFRKPAEAPDRGPAGIEYDVPAEFRTLDLGESNLEAAAQRLLEAIAVNSKVAAVFTDSGDRVQILVDREAESLDERVYGRHGTVRLVRWKDGVTVRLEWAREHGDFAAPGLPPPERRNPYH